jgi:hypothetical protein
MATVQHVATGEDAVDCPLRGQGFNGAGLEGRKDRLGPEEAQATLGLQLAAHLQDQVLEAGVGPLGGLGDRRAIGPIDPIEALAVGMSDPAVDRGRAHVEVAGDLLLRPSPSNGLNYRPTAAGFPVSLLMVSSSRGSRFRQVYI